MAVNRLYSDITSNLDPHPNTRDAVVVREERAVKQSIRNIVYTGKYERFHNPGFGAGLPQRLFENIGKMTEYEITERTREAIINNEPRCTNVDVLTAITADDNRVSVLIKFTTINIQTPVSLQLILKRVR